MEAGDSGAYTELRRIQGRHTFKELRIMAILEMIDTIFHRTQLEYWRLSREQISRWLLPSTTKRTVLSRPPSMEILKYMIKELQETQSLLNLIDCFRKQYDCILSISYDRTIISCERIMMSCFEYNTNQNNRYIEQQ